MELSQTDATLLAVSKTRTVDEILSIYQQGQRKFAENRIEEINRKAPLLPKDIEWHLIGPLQSRKVKEFNPIVHLFHALDRQKIWNKLNEWAQTNKVKVRALLQIHIAEEETKHGFSIDEIISILEKKKHLEWPNVEICGLMGMATNTDNLEDIRNEFASLKKLFDELQQRFFDLSQFTELSMGMSGDYKIAIEEGATMIRVGSLIFGPRK